MLKICFVCGEYPPGPHGGIGTTVQVLGRALVQAGHQVRVVGACALDYPAPDYENDQGVGVWRLREPGGRFGWLTARYHVFQTVARWCQAGLVDIVEVPDYQGLAAGWPSLPVPVVARLNGSGVYFAAELHAPLRRSVRWLEAASARRVDFWCAASQYIADRSARLFGMTTPPIDILYNPVEWPETLELQARSPDRVVFTGTLIAKKGVISLLRAWPAVLARRPNAELHLYGKDTTLELGGSMRSYLGSLLDERSSGSVHFHGHVQRSQLVGALGTARAAVFPSYSESFGIAPFEAMAHACPTIYTRLSCGPELVEDGVDGLLIDPDKPDEIAGAILRFLEDDALANKLGAAGRELVRRRYAIQTMLPRNEQFYRYCVNAFGTRSVERKLRGAPIA